MICLYPFEKKKVKVKNKLITTSAPPKLYTSELKLSTTTTGAPASPRELCVGKCIELSRLSWTKTAL